MSKKDEAEALDLARKALEICEQDGYIPVRLTRDALTAIKQARSTPVQNSDHEFKNFHRLLCERFGYTHDEVDWKRDQISLIEWIAKQVKPAAPVPLTDDQVDAATKAWFENDIVAGRYPFRKRMRAAFAAAHGITKGEA
jgi:hypothetical protein